MAPTTAWANHGIGVGFETCDHLAIPVDPHFGFYLSREVQGRHIAAERFNRMTIFGSREFVAHKPNWENKAGVNSLRAMERDLETQRWLRIDPTMISLE